MPRTGILDLPIELRQSIYTELLPDDLTFTYDTSECWRDSEPQRWHAERTIAAVYEAAPCLKRELEAWINKTCGFRSVISPEHELPSAERLGREQRAIDIFIAHDHRYAEVSELRTMHEKMVELVSRLQQSHGSSIRKLWVAFQDDSFRINHGKKHHRDEHWCRAAGDLWDGIDSNGSSYYEDQGDDCVLREMLYMDISIVEYLLLPLLELPVCASVTILTPIGADRSNARFDLMYLVEFENALRHWLIGGRRVPWSTLNNDFDSVVCYWFEGIEPQGQESL